MISEGSCDTDKTGVMTAEYSALQSQEKNLHLKYIKIENLFFSNN